MIFIVNLQSVGGDLFLQADHHDGLRVLVLDIHEPDSIWQRRVWEERKRGLASLFQ
jgi:hypothetical protein